MFQTMLKPGIFKHRVCRNNIYPRSTVQRFPVPDDMIFWNIPYDGYAPPEYTSQHVPGQMWADPYLDDEDFNPNFNELDGNVNRESFMGKYEVRDGVPINPMGRTGMCARGLLGRWGPNHAADPIVTRWKRDFAGQIMKNAYNDMPILQMVAIQRYDNRLWAIPGGMVDPDEKVTATLKREFLEETSDGVDNLDVINNFFKDGVEIYRGYVDDFRNTDNAWMETVAYSFHDETGLQVGKIKLSAGDDASNVKWMDVHSDVRLHANHSQIVQQVAERLKAFW